MGVGPLACGDPSPSPSGKVELPRGATHGPQMWPAHACTIRPYDLCTGCCACDGEDCAVAQISGEALNRRVYAPRSGRGVPSKASLLAASDSLFSMQKSTLQTAAAADAVGVLTMVMQCGARSAPYAVGETRARNCPERSPATQRGETLDLSVSA